MKDSNYVSFIRSIPILIRSRLEAIFTWSWCTAINCLIVGRGFPPIQPALLSVLAMILISVSVYLYNDIIDQEMDSLNPIKKNRPVASNIVSEKDSIKLIYLTGFFGLAITLFLNTYSFIFSIIFLVLFTVYSYPKIRLKTKFLGKEFVIFTGFWLCSLVSSYAIIGEISLPALYSTLIFGTFAIAGMPALADFTDIEEDRLYGVKNLSVILSWKRKVQLLIFGVLFVMTMTPLTYVHFNFNIFVPIIIIGMSLIFLRLMFPIMYQFEHHEVFARARKITYVYFIFLQVLLIIGSLKINL